MTVTCTPPVNRVRRPAVQMEPSAPRPSVRDVPRQRRRDGLKTREFLVLLNEHLNHAVALARLMRDLLDLAVDRKHAEFDRACDNDDWDGLG